VIKALIFDVDGTLAETEEVHRAAFNKTFIEAGLDWHWDRKTYERLLKVTGGRERMEHHARLEGLALPDSTALHKAKTAHYNAMISNAAIELRPGVERLIRDARAAGLSLAIATTTSRPNVDSLLAATLGSDALSWFAAICCGEDVRAKKPDPEVYQLTLDMLSESAENCLAFEDSANGLRAANAAGLRCIITPGVYTADDDFTGAAAMFNDLSDEAASLNALLQRFS
jgi:HAD superfamily hydrolase (TIGR01509 family)